MVEQQSQLGGANLAAANALAGNPGVIQQLLLQQQLAQVSAVAQQDHIMTQNSLALQLEIQQKLLQASQLMDNSAGQASETPANGKLKRQLPPTFLPSSNTVIVIDDNDPAKTPIPGNKLLRDLGFQWLDEYMTVPESVNDLRDESLEKFNAAVRRHKVKRSA